MSGNRLLVAGFIITTFVLWLVFDAWLGPNGGPTESQVLAFWVRHLTSFSFLMGALCGHWFLGRKSAQYALWPWPFGAILLLTLWDIYFIRHFGYVEPAYRSPWIWFLGALPVGSIFWPQQDSEALIP